MGRERPGLTPGARAVRCLRILEACGAVGATVAELALACGVAPRTIRTDLSAIRAADEPLEADGPLTCRETRVRLVD